MIMMIENYSLVMNGLDCAGVFLLSLSSLFTIFRESKQRRNDQMRERVEGEEMKREDKMEISPPIQSTAITGPSHPQYSLPPGRFMNEDILFCVDVDVESQVEIKSSNRITRMDAIKQALLLFIHAKLAICPDHRFCFSVLGQSFTWLRRELSNDVNLAARAVRLLTSLDKSYGIPDLTSLFQVARQEAIRSFSQGRLFRVILIYCRSSSRPVHRWPVSEKLFTMDVLYLHDKPGPENCPQKVYDALVDAVEHVTKYEGYIYENGQGARPLFRQMCLLLCHPLQRCSQDDLALPKSIAKRMPSSGEGTNGEEGKPILSQ